MIIRFTFMGLKHKAQATRTICHITLHSIWREREKGKPMFELAAVPNHELYEVWQEMLNQAWDETMAVREKAEDAGVLAGELFDGAAAMARVQAEEANGAG